MTAFELLASAPCHKLDVILEEDRGSSDVSLAVPPRNLNMECCGLPYMGRLLDARQCPADSPVSC